MLSNEQFGLFDKDDYYDDTKMNYGQFRDRADFFHSSPEYTRWDRNYTEHAGVPFDEIPGVLSFNDETQDYELDEERAVEVGNKLSHVGTEKAAHDRAGKRFIRTDNYWLHPLQHVGEFANPRSVHGDVGAYWGKHQEAQDLFESGKTLRYENGVEDPGSISAIGPSQNFRSYPDYVGDIPEHERTSYQKDFMEHHARTGHGGYEEYPNEAYLRSKRRYEGTDPKQLELSYDVFENYGQLSRAPEHPSVKAAKYSGYLQRYLAGEA